MATETKPIAPDKPEESAEPNPAEAKPSADAQAKLQKLIEAAQQMCNAPQKGQSPPQSVAEHLPMILKHMVLQGCLSKNQFVGMVATVYVETGTFAPIFEDMVTATTKSFPDGGPQYRGRGWIQLTHDYNYKACGEFLKMDLLGNPDLAVDPEVSGQSTLWYWTSQGTGGTAQQAAEAGDWDNVRAVVNAGRYGAIGVCHGVEEFRWAIQKGLEVVPDEGIDPAVVGVSPLPNTYGSDDFDTGGAGQRVVNSGATSQGDALAYALGLHALDRSRQLEFRAVIDPTAFPAILNADIQKSMEIKGFEKELDGDYTIDSLIFYGGDRLECEVVAYKPDPNAPKPQIFPGSTDANLGQPQGGQNASPSSVSPGQVSKNGDEVKLGMPYLSQLDNIYNPSGSCNATSIAMALMFLGVKKKDANEKDLGNEIYPQLAAMGAIPGTPDYMVAVCQRYGIPDRFEGSASDDEIKKWLESGKPIVIHGDFTNAGHIVAVSGFNKEGFYVHDPWGKFLGTKASYDNNASGEFNVHSFSSIVPQFWHDGSGTWTHFIG